MTAYQVQMLWCVVQVAIVAGLGAAATWLLSRSAPGAAATSAAGAAATILVVTALAPVPAPSVFEWQTAADAATDALAATGNARRGAALDEGNGVGLDLRALVTRGLVGVGELVRAKPQAASRAGNWIGVVVGAGTAVGMFQLAGAALYLRRLRRECVRVVDFATCEAFKDVARRLVVRRPVQLCESRELASPAVLGWRRPIVLLPADRAGWTDEQLRATLAHELAHVVRGDFTWRLAASCVRAMHFVHPLVHVLTQRLALAQELAADRLAATALGGSTNYVRALSELALQLDDRARLRAEPLVLPALSTHLTRRIAMLRSTEGSVDTKRRRLVGVAAAGMIALVGAATTALRGVAEGSAPNTADSPAAELFSRPEIDLSRLGGLHQGLFVVRLGELVQRPAIAPLVADFDAFCRRVWPEAFGVEAPRIDLTAIEYLAGVPQLTIEPIDDAAKESGNPHNSRMMTGCGEVVMRFTRDLAWEEWLSQYVPKAVRKTEGELAYYELPAIPAMGKESMLVASVDSRTLVCTWGVARLKAVIAGVPAETSAVETAQWDAIDRGLIALVADDSRIDRNTPTPKAPQAREILENVRRYGLGFDVDAATNEAEVRVDLACADGASAERVRSAAVVCLDLLRTELRAGLATIPHVSSGQDAELQTKLFWADALENSTVELAPPASDSAGVRISGRANFPRQLAAAQVVAEKPDSPTTSIR